MASPDPSSRIFVIEGSAPLAPGVCTICGSCGGDGRKFIDFGHHMDFYGRVYYCSTCFEEVTSYLGWMSPVNSDILQTRINDLELDLKIAKDENERINSLLNNSLVDLRSQLDQLLAVKEAARKPVGRPKKSESSTTDNSS